MFPIRRLSVHQARAVHCLSDEFVPFWGPQPTKLREHDLSRANDSRLFIHQLGAEGISGRSK